MVRLFKSAAARALSLLLLALVVGAALLGAVRLAVPFAEHLRAPVEGLLAETLGLDAEVGAMAVRLVGWAPRLSLSDTRLLDAESGRTQLSLTTLHLDLDPVASLRARAPKIAALTLVGAHLMVRRHADGRLSVAGLEGLAGGGGEAITFFLGNGRFLLTESDVYLVDEGAGAPAIHLADVAMRFDNTGPRHRIGVQGRLFGDAQTQVRLVADLAGPPGDPARWRGPVYVRWQGEDLGPVLGGRLPPGLHLGSTAAEIEGWGELEDGALLDALARFELGGLAAWRADPAGGTAPAHIERLEGLVHWRAEERGWRLDLDDLAVTRRGATSAPISAGLRLSRNDPPVRTGEGEAVVPEGLAPPEHRTAGGSGGASPDADGWTAAAHLSGLDLALAADLLALLVPRPAVLAAVQAGRVEGAVSELSARYQAGEAPSWSVQGRIDGLAFAPVGSAPGVHGLAGSFRLGETGGTLVVAARDLSIELPGLLRGPIALDQVSGPVHWTQGSDGGLRVQTPELIAVNADIRTRSRLDLHLPGDPAGEPLLDMQTDFADAEAAAVRRYLPVGVLKPGLIRWLDRALVAGRVPSGTLIFRGTPAAFPFAEGEGRFLLDISVRDAVLDYRAGWPAIEDLAARVRFDGPSLSILASGGRLLDSDLSAVSAAIADLMDVDRRTLVIEGRAEGPFAAALRVLRETPLAERFGTLAAQLEGEGRSRLDLDLRIPLGEPGGDARVELQGVLSWPEPAALALPRWGTELVDLGGELRFSHQGLAAEAITARLWDAPVRVRIGSDGPDGEPGGRTWLWVEGQHASATLARRLPSPLWDLVRGTGRWSLAVDIRGADLGGMGLPLALVLTSDLRGMSVDLPAPLGKTAGAARPLRLSGRLAAEGGLEVTGSYGDLGIALVLASGPEGGLSPSGALLHFGGVPEGTPPPQGVRLTGSLDDLDLTAWGNWWERRGLGAPAGDRGRLTLVSAELRARRLLVSDLELRDLSLRLERQRSGWRGELESRELAGTVLVADRPRETPIEIRLARLDLKGVLGEPGGPGATREPKSKAGDPRRSPTLDLRVERLLWGEELIGALTLSSEPRPEGVALTGLALDGPLLMVRGRGAWTTDGARQRSEIKLTAEASDMGAFLRLIELKSQLDQAPGNATIELTWPGGPADFSLAAMRGRATAEVGAGSLRDVEPGVGRMLGILNLAALQRRLSLDFRDFFDRGYAFEEITGALAAEGGKARIERLTIEAPSASVSVEGETDLVAQRFDQVVTVTPRLGSSLAVATAVAAGPLVGAAVYLADKVSGGAVDRIGRHQYEVSGPWEDPEIRRRGASAEAAPDAPPATVPPPPVTPERPEAPPAPPSDLGPFFDAR